MKDEDLAEPIEQKNPRSLWKLVASSSIIASMCCLPSIVLVMFGIATVSTGAALSDTLYWGEDGYLRIERSEKKNDVGICGIASQASFPVAI